MTAFLNNQVIKWNETEYRVLATLKGDVALCEMDDSRNLSISYVPESTLTQAKKDGKLQDIEDRYLSLRLRRPTGKSKEKAEEGYKLIEPIISCPEAIFFKKLRSSLIAAASNGDKVLRRKIYRTLGIYYRRGQAPGALNPTYVKEKKVVRKYTKKVGRHSAVEQGVVLNDEVRALFDQICQKHLLTDKPLSMRLAHQHLVAEYLAKHPQAGTNQVPTRRQLHYYFTTHYNQMVRSRKRHDDRTYNKDIRALTGNTYDVTDGAGAVYEIDATQADVYLASETGKPIGRPYIYVVVDRHTGLIAGMHVSLDPPQYKTACDAIYNAIIDKTEFCRAHGIELGNEHHWDAKGIPACIVADNAELQSDQFESFLRAYNVANSFTPSGRPDCKGTVEKSIDLLQTELRQFIDAAPDNIKLRKAGHKEKRHLATLTLNDLTKMLIRATLIVNKRLRVNTPKYLPASVAPTPELLWKWSIDHHISQLTHVDDPKRLRITLLPKVRPSLSEDGITADKITYFCAKARDLGYFERRGQRPNTDNMLLARDPDDVSIAYFFPNTVRQPATYWECTLASKCNHLEKMSLNEAKKYQEQAKITAQIEQQKTTIYAAEMLAKQTETVKKAKQRKAESTKSVAQQIAEISDNRQSEKEQQRQKNPRIKEALPVKEKTVQREYATSLYPDNLEDIPD